MKSEPAERVDSAFLPLLRSFKLANLRASSDIICGVWSDLRLAYLNPAWFQFAAANGGDPQLSARWDLGSSIQDGVAPVLREFFKTSYNECLTSGLPWHHNYECSSATTFREFHQVVYPLGSRQGLLIRHALVVERPHDPVDRPCQEAHAELFTDQHGLKHQCCYCRRMKNVASESDRWDWVPFWVERSPANTSHTICPICFGFYWPTADHDPEPATS